MATVAVKVAGGSLQELANVNTIADIASKLGVPNHQASVNGEPVDHDYNLSDDEYITFAEKVKGA